MKNFITNVGALVLCIALTIGGLVWLTNSDQTSWPDFNTAPQSAEPLAPQVVSVFDRDFGWRIADVIPIEIYLKQKPGTVVDLHSLAIEGDFEIVENPTTVTRDFQDGSRWIGIKFKIQSMSAAKQLSLKVSMIYRDIATSEDHLIAIPAFEPFTSPTWDGRDLIKDGKPSFIHEYHLLWTLGYILSGIAGAIIALRLQRQWKVAVIEEQKRIWETRRQIARREFDEAWALIEAGDVSVENYKAVAKSVRKLFRIESKVLKEIEMELGGMHPYKDHTLKIMALTGQVLYHNRYLTDAQNASIKETFDQIVPPSVGHDEVNPPVSKEPS
ncbi:MAG: hypothetical protein SGJ27_30045 [Candidatus Melainabacteria bacterium]|nr:hypothetical protein [Candidatus Melainabacteria bacterium]